MQFTSLKFQIHWSHSKQLHTAVWDIIHVNEPLVMIPLLKVVADSHVGVERWTLLSHTRVGRACVTFQDHFFLSCLHSDVLSCAHVLFSFPNQETHDLSACGFRKKQAFRVHLKNDVYGEEICAQLEQTCRVTFCTSCCGKIEFNIVKLQKQLLLAALFSLQ